MLGNLNRLQRRWAMASGVLFALALGWTVWKFPTESQLRERWAVSSGADLQNYTDVQKELTDHCVKYAKHTDPAIYAARYKTCWDSNRKFYEVAVRSKNNRIEELKTEFDRQLHVVLPKQQVATVLRGLSIWLIPSLSLFVGWLLLVWRRNDYSLRWVTKD